MRIQMNPIETKIENVLKLHLLGTKLVYNI